MIDIHCYPHTVLHRDYDNRTLAANRIYGYVILFLCVEQGGYRRISDKMVCEAINYSLPFDRNRTIDKKKSPYG